METLPPLTIADKVFADLVRAIVEGQIPAGSKISEPELAKSHGISRGPLREAIARLEACGLVIRKPNVGARVVMLSAQDMVEISEVREPLEGMACRLAAEKSTPEDIRELRALLEQHQAQDALQKGQGYFQKAGDLDFHYRIVQCCKNQKLIGLLCDDLYHLVRM
ncbi:MAG: GntR family transcriptional regulator, partial [Cellvibrionaceae bacterium]|nr:GntR family transcriptional regulator [Cellvibrionaceae bacterium]